MANGGDIVRLGDGSHILVNRSATEDPDGVFEVEITLPPVSKRPRSFTRHLHPAYEERWDVVSGTCEVELGSEQRLLKEGESVRIPAGTVHELRNNSGAGVSARVSFSPGIAHERFLDDFSARMQGAHAGSGRKLPNLLRFASLMHSHRHAIVPAKRGQRVAVTVLAGVNKVVGPVLARRRTG